VYVNNNNNKTKQNKTKQQQPLSHTERYLKTQIL